MNIQQILVPVDASEYSHRAVVFASGLARSLSARLVLLHVVPATPSGLMGAKALSDDEFAEWLKRIGHDVLYRPESTCKAANVSYESTVEIGDPAAVIVDTASKRGVQLIVMGSRGLSDLKDVLLGGVSHKVISHATVPVTVVR